MFHPAITASSIAWAVLFLCSVDTLFAQYSEEAFTQKKAGELYDERGFYQNKAITVDGKLVVSNSNGNVSYSYPVASWQVDGYGFSSALNYCGSVAFSTFGEYSAANENGQNVSWSRFSQNRPVWLLGVNGFAVQALTLSTAFHAEPSWIDYRYTNTSVTTFDDEDFVWTIDGYDICNRMQDFNAGDFSETAGGVTRNIYRDVIHLLRDDGSVMELLNVNSSEDALAASDNFAISGPLYSGYYVINEANQPGYAWVEFITDQNSVMPWTLDALLPDYPRLTPRRVHYYPGDGLEYIFEERYNPYGNQDLRDPILRFGGMKANPTIFYLSEIKSAGRTLVAFTYSRHGVQDFNSGDLPMNLQSDSTKGRALLTRFGQNTVSYGDGWMSITALGRTTIVKFDQTISYSGNATNGSTMPIASWGYYNGNSQAISRLAINNDGAYNSWVGYVTQIIDPEHRTTNFDYEQYERRQWDYGFPRSSGAQHLQLILKNYRLSEIEEPSAKYEIAYHNRGGGVTVDADGPDTLTLYQGEEGHYPFAFSNAARQVEKRDLNNTLLSTDTYDCRFYGTVGESPTTPEFGIVVTEDAVTGLKDSTVYRYTRATLPRSLKHAPAKYYTGLNDILHYTFKNGVLADSSATQTFYYGYAPYLWLPYSEQKSINTLLKSSTEMFYRVDTVRTYGGDDTLIKYHGMEISQQVTNYLDPLSGQAHRIDTTELLNVPEFDTTITHIDTVPDWGTMRRRYDSLRYQVYDSLAKSVDFSKMLDDPRIWATKPDTIVDGTYRVPPLFHLPERQWTSDVNGNYLGGKSSYYCLTGDCDGGPATSSWTNRLLLRGAKISDTTFGRGRHRGVTGSTVTYDHPNRNLPDHVENTFGSTMRFDYGKPGSPAAELGTGNVLANNDEVYEQPILSTSYFSRSFGVPQMQESEVRSYTSGGSLVKDTLTTMQELTYFGQTAKTVDPNGWLSEFDYDYNGRLNTAWLPYDFQPLDSIYYFDETGLEVSIGSGAGQWNTVTYDIDCIHLDSAIGLAVDYQILGDFLVNKPINIIPLCGGGYDTSSTSDSKGPSIQETAGMLHYTVTSPAIATLHFSVVPNNIAEMLSLDSAFVDLYVSSIIGECVTLHITSPDYETFEKTFVLNCEDLDPGGGVDTLENVEHLRFALGNYKDSIANDLGAVFVLETTTSGAEVRFVNSYPSEDLHRPQLQLYGTFRKFKKNADYTLHYEFADTIHDAAHLKSEVWAKVDDSAHTSSRGVGGAASLGESRRTRGDYTFGAGYRLLKGRTFIGDPYSPSRIDSTLAEHTGLGAVLKATDQVGDTVSTEYDALGRPVKTYNQDGTYSTIAYYTCGYDPDPDPECDPCPDPSCFDIDPEDQDFYGFILAKVTTNENGVKFVQYYDAFDHLRREVADSGGLNRTTKYEYDMLGRTTRVVNPAHDTTLYFYDDLGRVRYKQQPDLGTLSYAYDDLGNPRFVQTQEQEDEHRITFNEYDDLNRLVIVGEADFDDNEEEGGGGGGEGSSIKDEGESSALDTRHSPFPNSPLSDLSLDTRHLPLPGDPEKSGPHTLDLPTDDTLYLGRLTDQLDPNYLHDSGLSAILTASKTLWKNPATYGKVVPGFWALGALDTVSRNCSAMNSLRPNAVGPFLRHPAATYEPTAVVSTHEDFENLAKYPENVRIAISYDKLPEHAGPVWGNFPADSLWEDMTPRGAIRNLKGHESAVAYREHGGEPYHYNVLSYDERGRVEALLRYTENLGFDGVYYQYNSMNQVIKLTVVDPLRRYTTWYGYDHNGRVDSVWTKLESVNSGLWNAGTGAWAYPSASVSHTNIPEIRYLYTKTGQVDTMYYPRISTKTAYHYSPRKWLDTLIATRGANDIFREYLTFDATGQIKKQMSKQGTGSWLRQDYFYDALGQLTYWRKDSGSSFGTGFGELYVYDSVGNRVTQYNEDNTASITSWRNYDIGRRTDTNAGPNQMLKSLDRSFFLIAGYRTYGYDADGSQNRRKLYNGSGVLQLDETFEYSSWRGLSWKYRKIDPNLPDSSDTWEWRYRYNAMGEREQKRETLNPAGDGTAANGYSWTYYLLGGNKQQLSVWEGLQTSDATFCSLPGGGGSYVHLYPSEYLTYGGSSASVVNKPTATSAVTQEYRIADHLGSNRAILNNSGTVTTTTDYKPFGEVLSGSGESRKSFIDKERDEENELGNFGVRAYDYDGGRFTSLDPLWENYRHLSPYQYSLNSPIKLFDPSGFVVEWDGWSDEEKKVFMNYINRHSVLKDMFANMEASDKTFTIGYRGSKREAELASEQATSLKSLEKDASFTWSINQKGGYDGTGTNIYFSFNKEGILADGNLDPNESTENKQRVGHWIGILGHEFFHAGQRSRGIESTERTGFIWNRELQGVAIENYLRTSFGIDPIKQYGGISLSTDNSSVPDLLKTIGINVPKENKTESGDETSEGHD